MTNTGYGIEMKGLRMLKYAVLTTVALLFSAGCKNRESFFNTNKLTYLEKRAPITMAKLAKQTTSGISVIEVNDYAPGLYTDAMTPSPPHADINPGKAFVVFWKKYPHRFVFSHEASYCPLLELPSGAAMCNQFFEGNLGEAELFNNMGRKEKNSFVDILESGHQRVWIRWTYFAVNMNDDSKPRLRGTEDYFGYPNGLMLRRATYQSLMPDNVVGYATDPVELFGVLPAGLEFKDVFQPDVKYKDYLTLTAMDLYSDIRYDIYWDENKNVRRNANDAALEAISKSKGCALVLPFRDGLLFAVFGNASGFPSEKNQLIDHCTPQARGGCGWGVGLWDHWPIGWLNSQTSFWKPGSPYAYSFGSIGQFFVPDGKRISSFANDYPEYCKDMQLNKWTENRIFYVLLGTADDWNEIRSIGKKWLDKGSACTSPDKIKHLR
ncbi:MAG: hypothetical protein A2Y10_03550 [Planctomycetes bacterium GWF2_41_51]|nr:MAG: hypothetical protein A2Y10_03550 [Planctomycetes bacterium GWF2_41_51]HBG28944.1 hypothetical protein [Phycisphaerales bacterium]